MIAKTHPGCPTTECMFPCNNLTCPPHMICDAGAGCKDPPCLSQPFCKFKIPEMCVAQNSPGKLNKSSKVAYLY